jgi:UDP-N-acetyl-D-glucosamine dehydrogenase
MKLKEKILNRTARIGIVGLGYVGLPEAVALAKIGFNVYGIDIDKKKVKSINAGKNYIEDISDEDFAEVVKSGKLKATTDDKIIKTLDVVTIAVPTPFNDNKEPDLSYIVNVANSINKNFKKDSLIILESTTYTGTTREILMGLFEKSGYKAGKDYYLAFSPERIDPGNKKYTINNTPKVVGGITKKCTEMGKLFYSQFVEKVVTVSTPEAAEMVKLLENIFRNVNIALLNELALLCDRMKIDIWEVVDAAKSKPFGFMPFYPGPGVGGHCIPVDPVYLSWKAKEFDFHTRFIELAAEINSNMPYYVVSKLLRLLHGKPLNKCKVLLLGAAFKKDISDMRNSPSLKVMELLKAEDVNFIYNDPHVPTLDGMRSTKLTEKLLKSMDAVVILTEHSDYDYEWIVANSKLVLDTRNAAKEVSKHRDRIVKI